jgi:hypothetical protein
LGLVAKDAEAKLLEVENDLDDVFFDAINGGKLVSD